MQTINQNQDDATVATPNTTAVQNPAEPPEWSRLALESIRLQNHPGGGYGVRMPGNYWVTETTMRRAWMLFWRSVASLDPYQTHSAKSLGGEETWSVRPRGERIAMGRCFKYFALKGVLPIVIVNPDAKYNFKYLLTTNVDQAEIH